MTKKPKDDLPGLDELQDPVGYLIYSLRELKKLADETDDEKVKLRALAHLAKAGSGFFN